MLDCSADDPKDQTNTGPDHDTIDPDHMQVTTDFIFNLVDHLGRIPFMNTFTDKTNHFLTVLVT